MITLNISSKNVYLTTISRPEDVINELEKIHNNILAFNLIFG